MTKPKSITLEEQIKILQKHFGSIIVTVKDLKCSMDRLEKKVDEREAVDIKDIIKQQEALEKVISANADAIKRLDEELVRRKEENVLEEVPKDTDEPVNDEGKMRRKQKFADISTEDTVSTRTNADLFFRKISVRNI